MITAYATLLASVSCAAAIPDCAFACISPGQAATAGHCVGQPDPAVIVPVASCESEPVKRRAVPGETITIGNRTMQVVDIWLDYIVLAGPCYPGESGSGAYGSDGALLGVVIRNHSDQCYAEVQK